MPVMDTTTTSCSDTKTSFKYGKLVPMFFHQLLLGVGIWPIHEKFKSFSWMFVLDHLASLWWCTSTEIGVLLPMVE
jgi:hypothetical protein